MKPTIVEVTPKNTRHYTTADIDMASGRDLGMLSWQWTPPQSSTCGEDGRCHGISPYGHKCILPWPHLSYCTAVIDSDCPEKVLNK